MRRFFSLRQLAHAPATELHNGGFSAHAETPSRAEMIVRAIGGAEEPVDYGDAAIGVKVEIMRRVEKRYVGVVPNFSSILSISQIPIS